MLTLTTENFDAVLEVSGPLLVDFWAPWCGPCMKLEFVLEEIDAALELFRQAASNPNVVLMVGKVNTEEQPLLAARFTVRGIPCLILFRDGVEIARRLGFGNRVDIEGWVHQVLNQ